MRRMFLATTMLLLMVTMPWSYSVDNLEFADAQNTSGRDTSVIISELYVSPNDANHDGVDWNGDGDVGEYSDQFIEIWNAGDTAINVSSWILSTTSGSPPCQLPYNTMLEADARLVVFRADSDLELSYHDGENVSLTDTLGNPITHMSYPPENSTYGKSYITENGILVKAEPTPGRVNNFSDNYTVPDNIAKCYKITNNDSARAFLLKGRVVTMDGENNVINDGNVMIRDGKITGVWASNANPPAGVDFSDVPIIDTGGTIYPGLIDLHNHVHYNHIPLWDIPCLDVTECDRNGQDTEKIWGYAGTTQRSAEGGYTNRGQWGDNYDYGPSVTWMKTNIQSQYRWDMASEQMKYAEVQAVSGGVTAMQGSPSSGTQAWDSILSRNVELYNFGQDGITTCAVCAAAENKGTCQYSDGSTVMETYIDDNGTADTSDDKEKVREDMRYANNKQACLAADSSYQFEYDYTGSHLISQSNSGTLNAWFVHLAEGVDQKSKNEFDIMWDKGLIMDETIVIHGTALDSTQFSKMASVNSELVWSPLSNLLLYGNTTDVIAADQAGVSISISPDWGPSGSKNNLHELKVADLWNSNNLEGYFSNYELVEMVTSNPADATGWASFVGRVKADMFADLVVIDTFHEDPYRNLIEAVDADVALTVVQGKAVFGDVDIMQELQGDDWEYVNGSDFQKAVDVTSLTEVDGSQTFAEIEAGLAMAMRHELSDMKEHWSEFNGMTDNEINNWLGTTFDGDYRDGESRLRSLTLDPIFTSGDTRYFEVINRSTHANVHIDLSKLYDNYYTIEMVNGDRVNVDIQLPVDVDNNRGDATTLPGPTGDNNTDDQDNMFTDLPDDEFRDDAEADASTQNQLKLILLIIVVALLFGLYVISKTSNDDELLNSQTSVVDKLWEDDAVDESIDVSNEAEQKIADKITETIDIKDKITSAMKSSGLSAVRLFTAIDQTKDGYVSRREIRGAVNTLLKDSVKVSDIDALLEVFDTNDDGVISLDEFLTAMEKHQPKQFVPVLPDLKPPSKQ